MRAPMLGEARRFVVYGMVGVVNTAVDFLVFLALAETAAVSLLAANALGFVAGATTSYLLNGAVTFRSNGPRRLMSAGRIGRFAAVTAVCLAVSSVAFAGALAFGSPLLAKVVATAATLVVGYLLNRAFVFAPAAAAVSPGR